MQQGIRLKTPRRRERSSGQTGDFSGLARCLSITTRSTLPGDTSLKQLVRLAKLRWRIERDYQEMKQEIGLDHFEGRGWMGFHHHATLCGVAHGFLALRRAQRTTAAGPAPAWLLGTWIEPPSGSIKGLRVR